MNGINAAAKFAQLKTKRAAALARTDAGTYSSVSEFLDWEYYDTEKLASTINTYTLFNGSADFAASGSKGIADRNFLSGQMPKAQSLEVHALKLAYLPVEQRSLAELQQVIDFLNNATMQLIIENKAPSIQAPLHDFMGITIPIVANPATTDNVFVGFQGVASRAFPVNIPIVLASQVTFRVVVQGVAPNANLDGDRIRVFLNGKLERIA